MENIFTFLRICSMFLLSETAGRIRSSCQLLTTSLRDRLRILRLIGGGTWHHVFKSFIKIF